MRAQRHPAPDSLRHQLAALMHAVAHSQSEHEAERRRQIAIATRSNHKLSLYFATQRRAKNDAIVAALRTHGRLPTVELAKRMGKERSSIFKHLVALVEEGKVIRHEGKFPEWEAA